jgi:phage shock protein A
MIPGGAMKAKPQHDLMRAQLTRWVEHSQEHADELRHWARRAFESGDTEVASGVIAAVIGVEAASDSLRKVLERLAGSDGHCR